MLRALTLLMALSLVACGGGKSKDQSSGQNDDSINWDSITEDFNPNKSTYVLDLYRIKYVDLSLLGKASNIRVTYSNQNNLNLGSVVIYKVRANNSKTSIGHPGRTKSGDTLFVKGANQFYECSMEVENGELTNLKGACYVKVELVLPIGAQVEAYYNGDLITQRFHPMTTMKYRKQLAAQSFDNSKLGVISNFINSYRDTGRRLSIFSGLIDFTLNNLSFSKNKLSALSALHRFVEDRENLNAVVEKHFFGFDKRKAKDIIR